MKETIKIKVPKLNSKQWGALIVGILFIGSSVGFAFLTAPPQHVPPANDPTAVDGVSCAQMEFTDFHIHAHLDIFVNNERVEVPANTGILLNEGCLYWLHTHDATGIIHIEAPTRRDFTLGQFMNIWTRTWGSHPLEGKDVVVFVNGESYEGDYRQLKLESHQSITLAVDSDVQPQIYTFPRGL